MLTYTKQFVRSYLFTALWASTITLENDEVLECLEEKYSIEDFNEMSKEQARVDCLSFIWANRKLLREARELDPHEDADRAGHDFWLTRNGHGAGFWDRGLGEVGKKLTEASKAYGSLYLWLDVAGKVVID